MYIIEMRNITKEFPGIIANDDITLQLKKGEIHALLGENGAGKSTLMSVLFGLYTPEKGEILKNDEKIKISGPNDATRYGIGMVHQHFKLVHNFTVLENILLGVETTKFGLLSMVEARARVVELSKKYGLSVDPDALISNITVGMQQRVEILKMLYRENEILIFDEPTAVLTPQEIDELMKIMKDLITEGKSILFITHKLDEIKRVADRCTVLRKGKLIGTVDVKTTEVETMSEMMVGRKVNLIIDKPEVKLGEVALEVTNLTVKDKITGKNVVNNVSFKVHEREIVCIAGIDGNGQSELVYAITGLMPSTNGVMVMNGVDISNLSIRKRCLAGMGHIPEDRHKHGLVLDYNLAYNLILQSYFSPQFQKYDFLRFNEIYKNSDMLIERYDIRSGQGGRTPARSMSGGNQQKTILARELSREPKLLVAVQPTRGLDVGAIEYIHKQLIIERAYGGVLLVSLELDEVMNVSDRILVMYEGEIVADVDPKKVTYTELGLYMSGAKRDVVNEELA
ncbi:MAG: ABC transporter ATP-binding protein [Oscillospiraceae bacterium]|jgi:simple sugar transport system ATP-binding protein|nr:ABC transporter ATP-binding protein [Oscillospiraceae bacterium]